MEQVIVTVACFNNILPWQKKQKTRVHGCMSAIHDSVTLRKENRCLQRWAQDGIKQSLMIWISHSSAYFSLAFCKAMATIGDICDIQMDKINTKLQEDSNTLNKESWEYVRQSMWGLQMVIRT